MKGKVIYVIAAIASLFLVSYTTYAIFKNNATSSTTVTTANFVYDINSYKDSSNSTLILNETITNNKPLIPGAEGHIILKVNLTGTEVDTNYTINILRTNLPDNIHFYSNSTMTNEITSISGTYLIGGTPVINNDVYWKWVISDTEQSNANDSLFMEQNLEVSFDATFTQKVGAN